MKTITKEKISEMLKNNMGLSGPICDKLVNEIFNELINCTISEGKLMLKNFGNFRINNKAARPGINLQTKKPVIIPARKVMSFLPAKAFKKQIQVLS